MAMRATCSWIIWNWAMGLAELLALIGVFDHRVQTGLGQSHAAGRGRQPGLVQGTEDDLGAVAQLAQNVLLGHLDVLQVNLAGGSAAQAQLVQ